MSKSKVYVVGDSTVCDYGAKPDNYYMPRFGYGTQLYSFLDLEIVNLALSGRSSLSFLSESNYSKLKNSIGEGDFLVIGFGHNDEKSADKARFTDPAADFRTATTAKGNSFQYTLYENYVKLARDRGAIPVLCTPIVRYAADGVYEGKCVHVTEDGDYAAAIKKLGADTETAVVDLTKITKDYYSSHNDEAKLFHAHTTYSGDSPDGRDNTHLNKYGAKRIAFWLLNNLPKDCPLTAHVNGNKPDGDYKDAINLAYIKPDYDGFNPSQHTALATVSNADWYATFNGARFGAGKFTITADGRFSGTDGDGFGAVFVQIDESKNFRATVKAQAAGATESGDGIAFGMMLRDDIYIDGKKPLFSNFVSASVTAGGRANMSRTEKLKLDYGGRIPFTKKEYALTVERVGQVVTVTTDTVKTTFTDISFVGVDNTKMYLCLFASGGLTVDFTDVSFAITGESQGA